MNKKIGFIGTGLMGFPMAKNLLKTNYSLKVFSRSINKAKPLETFGAKICNNLIEVVSDSDLVITMLTDDNAVEKVLSDNSFLDNLKPSAT